MTPNPTADWLRLAEGWLMIELAAANAAKSGRLLCSQGQGWVACGSSILRLWRALA